MKFEIDCSDIATSWDSISEATLYISAYDKDKNEFEMALTREQAEVLRSELEKLLK